jgi:hypothetical protein
VTAAHRSIDGSELHAGFIDACVECSPVPGTATATESPDDDGPPSVTGFLLRWMVRIHRRLVARFGQWQ